MILFRDISQYEEGDELFYELGEYKPVIVDSIKYFNEYIQDWAYFHTYNTKWVRSGEFKEITEPDKFINNGDARWNNLEWLEHHNFMLKKQ